MAALADGLVSRGHEVHVAPRPSPGLRSELTALPDSNIHPLRASLAARALEAVRDRFSLGRMVNATGRLYGGVPGMGGGRVSG